jgi:hypothetical protein
MSWYHSLYFVKTQPSKVASEHGYLILERVGMKCIALLLIPFSPVIRTLIAPQIHYTTMAILNKALVALSGEESVVFAFLILGKLFPAVVVFTRTMGPHRACQQKMHARKSILL